MHTSTITPSRKPSFSVIPGVTLLIKEEFLNQFGQDKGNVSARG
jgi:hypothetical protein